MPRLIVAGLSGDSGKTIASLSLLSHWRQQRLALSVFKKGPDYIDAAWLSYVSGSRCRNLDTFMVAPDRVAARFAAHAGNDSLALVEGNRGLFDGLDVDGTHSTATLARLLKAPVVLVVNATKTTRTLAALVKGCIDFDPHVKVAGVILNRLGGRRHRKIATEAIERFCGVPVVGAIPKLGAHDQLIPGRHLGLVTPSEHDGDDQLIERLAAIGNEHLDSERLRQIGESAPELEIASMAPGSPGEAKCRIGYFRDSVFTFYYPENLESLEAAGAELVPLSSLETPGLPGDLDGLYVGGGFPETQAGRLAANESLQQSVKKAIEEGLPAYAECGGLIYLSRSLNVDGEQVPMAGVFDLDLTMNRKPQGHGYVAAKVARANPFFDIGEELHGHEFHYTGPTGAAPDGCLTLSKGNGLGNGLDGLVCNRAMACYTHLHADGARSWAKRMVDNAEAYRSQREKGSEAVRMVGQAPTTTPRPAVQGV